MSIERWTAREGGVDRAAMTRPGPAAPDVIAHAARVVRTPVRPFPSAVRSPRGICAR